MMAKHGAELGAELYQLEKVARDYFPTIAGEYGSAVSNCDGARQGLDSAMQRPEHFGGSSLGPVHGGFSGLHNTVREILSDTKKNLEDTADALHTAAQLYAEDDQAAAQRLNERLDDEGMR